MKFKQITAYIVASALMFTSTAFAAVKEEVKEKPVYTYEQVLEKALKNSSDLSLLEQNLELMEKQNQSLVQSLGGIVHGEMTPELPPVTYPENLYTLLTSVNSMTTAMGAQKYQREALEKSLAYTVMTTMESITTSEEAIKLSEKQKSIYQAKYNKANLMERLGMVSANEKLAAKTELEKYEAALTQAKIGTENSYNGLARLMGMSKPEFEINYSVEYIPYKPVKDIAEYARIKNSTNPTIIMTKMNVENLRNSKTMSAASSSSPYSYDQTIYNISSAEAGLKALEDAGKAVIEGTYAGILSLEASIKELESTLEIAKKKLEATKTNFAQGRATRLELDEDELNVKTLENTITSSKMKHAALVYSFENPCVTLGGSSSR